MYTDHYCAIEYPFHGVFYKVGIDDSKPLDEQVEEEILIMETDCDMSDGTSLNTDTFTIFFPFDINKDKIVINEGDLIKADIVGMQQQGRVIGIYPSQLGGCTVLLTRL